MSPSGAAPGASYAGRRGFALIERIDRPALLVSPDTPLQRAGLAAFKRWWLAADGPRTEGAVTPARLRRHLHHALFKGEKYELYGFNSNTRYPSGQFGVLSYDLEHPWRASFTLEVLVAQ